jgi:hypothetical protein
MKPRGLLFMGLVLVLGTAVAAPATTVHTPRHFGPRPENLAQIIRDWDFLVDDNALRQALVLESLPPGDYAINHYAVDPVRSRSRGHHPPIIPLPGHGHHPAADGIRLLIPQYSGSWACDLTFTALSNFGFFEAAHGSTYLLSTQPYPATVPPFHLSGGLIFDLGEMNSLYAGQYIIAFETGGHHHFRCGLDYDDLVIHLSRLDPPAPAPLPGALPLLGGGLVSLVIFRVVQRRYSSRV